LTWEWSYSIFTSKLNYYRGSNAPWRSTPVGQASPLPVGQANPPPVGEPQVNPNPCLDCFVASLLAMTAFGAVVPHRERLSRAAKAAE